MMTRSLNRRIPVLAVLSIALLTLVATSASAFDQGVQGKKLLLKRSASGKEKLVVVLSDPNILFPAIGSLDDPTIVGMRVELLPGNGAPSASLVIPPSLGTDNWKTKTGKSTSYKFKNRDAPGGVSEIRAALLREGRVLKIVARGTGLALAAPQGSVGVRITTGQLRSCALFDAPTIRRDEPGQFKARKATTVVTDCSAASLGATAQCGDGVVDSLETCDVVGPEDPMTCVPAGQLGECTDCGGGSVTCCGPAVGIPSPPLGYLTCVSTSCADPWSCSPGDQCLPDDTCCAGLGRACFLTFVGTSLPSCCAGTVCGAGIPFGLACCVPQGGTCSDDSSCCSASCGAEGICEACLGTGAVCSSHDRCCTQQCGPSGTCECAATGEYCLLDATCCGGSCNATTQKCEP